CGYQNWEGYKFCGMCGVSVEEAEKAASGAGGMGQRQPTAMTLPPQPAGAAQRGATTRPTGHRTHNFHPHYHPHYFLAPAEGMYPRAAEPVRDQARDVAREEKLRSTAASLRGDLSRAEAAVRAITQEWVLACNTKHLDDLLELYASDALVLRSNYPP